MRFSSRRDSSLKFVINGLSRAVSSTGNLFAGDASRRDFSALDENSRGLELAFNDW
jgi:hypothetical protein